MKKEYQQGTKEHEELKKTMEENLSIPEGTEEFSWAEKYIKTPTDAQEWHNN